MKDRRTRILSVTILLLATSIFVLDSQVPMGVAVWVLYMLVVLVSLWFPRRVYSYATVLLCSVLTIVGLLCSPPGGAFWMSVTNGLLAVLAFWVAVVIGLAARRAAELEKANRALMEEFEQRKKLEAQLLRTQRLESIGVMASGIAHDFNNLLTPILMSVKLLKEDRTEEERLRLLDTLQASAERGADIVKQLLSFSGGTDNQRSSVQIKHLIKEISSLIEHTFPRAIQFQTLLAKDLDTVIADATQLSQVILNLCVNARDAMPNGGTLTIAAENVVLAEEEIPTGSEAKPGRFVRVIIEDTGTGMTPETVDKAFDPFFTTKGPGKGTGLGLSTALGILESHGGFIQLESTLGVGTRFTVFLPGQTAELADGREQFGLGVSKGKGQLILMVDDEQFILQTGKITLERHGYRVICADNGAEGVAAFQNHLGSIHAVILDMMMPGMDCPTVMAEFKTRDPRVPIIVTSGLRVTGPVALEIAAGRGEFLGKPYSDEQLLLTLARVLRGA